MPVTWLLVESFIALPNDNLLHPVAYFSTALTSAQKMWSTYNKETFALVCATRHWYVYLVGTKFVVKSDHTVNPHTEEERSTWEISQVNRRT